MNACGWDVKISRRASTLKALRKSFLKCQSWVRRWLETWLVWNWQDGIGVTNEIRGKPRCRFYSWKPTSMKSGRLFDWRVRTFCLSQRHRSSGRGRKVQPTEKRNAQSPFVNVSRDTDCELETLRYRACHDRAKKKNKQTKNKQKKKRKKT